MASVGVSFKMALRNLHDFYTTETTRTFKLFGGTNAFLSHLNSVSNPDLTPAKVGALVLLSIISPTIWGVIFAVMAHNLRMTVEWVKFVINSLYEEDHQPIQMQGYNEEKIPVTVVRNIITFPGTVIGLILGWIIGTVWANIAAIAYTAVGMGNLALNGEFAHDAYNDHLNQVARHVLGLTGTLIGFAIGLVPFVALTIAKSIVHSVLTFIYAVRIPTVLTFRNEDVSDSLNNITKEEKVLMKSLRGTRSDEEVFGYGFFGLVLGLLVGALPAVVYFLVGTVRDFSLAFKLAFRDVYNTVVDERFEVHAKLDELPLQQRFTFGLLGSLLGSIVAVTLTSGVLLLRMFTNSARLFASTAAGIINLTFTKPATEGDWFGFHEENINRQSRWAFGIPGIVLALGLVGIPCAAFTIVKNSVFFLAMVMSLIFTSPIRLMRQTYRYLAGDMVFSSGNKKAPPVIEEIMQRYMANAIDANGELVAGEVRPLNDNDKGKPYYTFGLVKNLHKLFRKSLQFDKRSEMEELLHDILIALRKVTDNNNITQSHLNALKRTVDSAIEKVTSTRIHSRYAINQICQQIRALGSAIHTELLHNMTGEGSTLPAVIPLDVVQAVNWEHLFFAKKRSYPSEVVDSLRFSSDL